MQNRLKESLVLGVFVFLGLSLLGYFIASSPTKFRLFDRTVSVKGLAEREVSADIALWPIRFTAAGNDLEQLYGALERDADRIAGFLESQGFDPSEVTVGPPAVTDKVAQNYGTQDVQLRYAAHRTVTVYTHSVDLVRSAKNRLTELGKHRIVFAGDDYGGATEYLFTGLNDLKPAMVEEATRNARKVAAKFARDSESTLGKIKTARQGQFTITDRDKNNPHLKRVRVVSTIEYYLSD